MDRLDIRQTAEDEFLVLGADIDLSLIHIFGVAFDIAHAEPAAEIEIFAHISVFLIDKSCKIQHYIRRVGKRSDIEYLRAYMAVIAAQVDI